MPLFGTKLLDVQFDDKALIQGVNAATNATLGGAARMASAFQRVAMGGNAATAAIVGLSGAASAFDSPALKMASHLTNIVFILTGLKYAASSVAMALGPLIAAFGFLGAAIGNALFFKWSVTQEFEDWKHGVAGANEELANTQARLAAIYQTRRQEATLIQAAEKKAAARMLGTEVEQTHPAAIVAAQLRGGLGGGRRADINNIEADRLEQTLVLRGKILELEKKRADVLTSFKSLTGVEFSDSLESQGFASLSKQNVAHFLNARARLGEIAKELNATGSLADIANQSAGQRRFGVFNSILGDRSAARLQQFDSIVKERQERLRAGQDRFREFQSITREWQMTRGRFGPDLTSDQMHQRGLLGQLNEAIERRTFEAGLPDGMRRFLGLGSLTPPASTGGGFADFSAFRGAGGQGITGVLDKQTRAAEMSLAELQKIRENTDPRYRSGGMG